MVVASLKRSFRGLVETFSSGCSCHKQLTQDSDLNEKEKEKHSEVASIPFKKKLFMKATVVTLEKKYAVCSNIAEFWCTITSVFFAFPLLLTLKYNFSELQAIHQTFITLSVITASMSFIYHWSLLKLFSSADAGFATIMVALGTIALCTKNPSFYPEQDWPLLWQGSIYGTALVFIIFWENTAATSLILFALFIPVNLFCLIQLEYYYTFINGLVGISFFLFDRLGYAPTHSLWHFFGGLYLYYLCWDLIH